MKKTILITTLASAFALVFAAGPASAAVTHTASGTYQTPSIGNEDVGGVCLGPEFLGTGDTTLDSCVVTMPLIGDVSVRITADDANSDNVSFSVGQRTPTGDITWFQSYCNTGLYAGEGFPAAAGTHPGLHTADGEPLELVVWVWVGPGVFNWNNGTFPPPPEPCIGVATTGTVSFTFYDTISGT
jgi:hypothetical protein